MEEPVKVWVVEREFHGSDQIYAIYDGKYSKAKIIKDIWIKMIREEGLPVDRVVVLIGDLVFSKRLVRKVE